MSFNSDIIKELSYNVPLLASTNFTTEKIIAGQFSSITLSMAADQDSTALIQFSNDGANWDINVSKNFTGGSSSFENVVILGKWMRITYSNNSITNMTYFRGFVYGSVMNTSLNALIQKIGNVSPEVSVDNIPQSAFGEIVDSGVEPLKQYCFNQGTTGGAQASTWQSFYGDLKSYSNSVSMTIRFEGGMVKIRDVFVNEKGMFKGGFMPICHEKNPIVRFSGLFVQGARNVAGPGAMTEYLGIFNGDVTAGTIDNAYAFGYGDPTLSESSRDSFGIIYFNKGFRTFIPRTSWNGDKANGTGILPDMDWEKLNIYQIEPQHIGGGNVIFKIMNPGTSNFVIVHTIRFANTLSVTEISARSMGFFMYMESEPGLIPIDNLNTVGCDQFSIWGQKQPRIIYDRFSILNLKTLSTISNVFSVRNPLTVLGSPNYESIQIDLMTIASDGTKSADACIFKNSDLQAPTWVQPYPTRSIIEMDTVGIHNGLGTGDLLYAFGFAKVSELMVDLSPYDIIIHPGDYVVFTARSAASTDITLSIAFHTLM